MTDEALRALARHPWPGNVAELQNVIEKLCVLSDTSEIGLPEVELHLGAEGGACAEPPSRDASKQLSLRIEEAEQAIRELRDTLGVPVDSGEPRAEPPELAEANRTDSTIFNEKRTRPNGFREQMDDAARGVLARTIREEGSISAAARALGVSRQQVYLKCKRLGLKDF